MSTPCAPPQDDPAFGERSRLVQAQDIDSGQAFDSGQLLDEHFLAGQPEAADGKRDARQQDQSEGYHGDHAGDHAHSGRRPRPGGDGALPAAPGLHLSVRYDDGDRKQRPRDPPQDAIEAVSDLGVDERKASCISREFARKGLGTNPRYARGSAAGNNDRTRENFTPRTLADGIGFAGEEGFVSLEPHGRKDGGIRTDLVAGPEYQDVVTHDVGRGDFRDGAITQHPGSRGLKDGEAVQRPLRPELLDDADDRVSRRCQPEESILPAPEEEQQQEACTHDGVEEGQYVGTKDVPQAAACLIRCPVRQTTLRPGGSLECGQAGDGGPGHTPVVPGWSLALAVCPHPLMVSGREAACVTEDTFPWCRPGCHFRGRERLFGADWRGSGRCGRHARAGLRWGRSGCIVF